jgi:hypothetical protein
MFVLAPALAASSLIGGFGQFGFGHSHTLPAFDLNPTSFVAHAPNALEVTLGPERAGIVVESLSRFGKTISLRPSGNAPVRMDYETTSLGFSLRYVNGMEWTGDGEEAPFITWSEGTVGPGVPAAAEGWVLLTWRNERPPLLLVFSNPVSLRSERTETGFKVSSPRWTGTVSVRLPFGRRSIATAAAADFGKLLQELRPLLPLVAKQAAKPLSAAVTPHAEGYEVVVRFDGPGAVIPQPAVENEAVRLVSPIVDGGPLAMPLCSTDEMRFVVRAPGVLRAGMPITYRAGWGSHDNNGVENRILAYLTGNISAGDSLDLSLLEPPPMKAIEPVTNIQTPLAVDGSGSYSSALRGLELVAQGKPAAFLDSLYASIDWATWQPAGGSVAERAEAAAALCLAGPYCRSLENRALAAMANAGIPISTGWDALRNAIYGSAAKPPWFAAFNSPLRILSAGIAAVDMPAGIKLSGSRETVESFDVSIASDAPIEIVSTENVSRNLVVGTGEVTTIRIWPQRFGEWSLIFRRSAAGSPIPKAVPSPRYSAVQR